jgi:hypothetical protein
MMEDKNYGTMLQRMTEDQQRQQKHIDMLTAQMKPLAQTSEGQFALQDKLADQSAPKEERAAAAQALAPGFVASIGKYGELSFSAAPMADMGQPAGQSFEQGRMQDKVTAGQQSTFMSNFDTVYTDIMNEKDPLKIAEKAGTLSAELSNVVNSKEAGVRSRLAQSLGINQLESQIAASTEDDKRLFAQNGMAYSGPTDETWQLINQRDQMTARMEQLVGDELSKDPELANIRTRMGALDTLIKQKQTLFGQTMADAQDNVGASINPDRIASARIALGVPDSPEANKEIAKGLMGNSPAYVKAEQYASATPELLFTAAVQGGVDGQMADRVLATKFPNPKDVAYIKDQVRNLDTSKMPKEERAQFELSAVDKTGSAEKQAQAQQAIQTRKVSYVLNQLKQARAENIELGANRLGQPDGWSMPTDPLLEELPQVVQDIKAADPKAVISTDRLLERMNWNGPNRAAKIKAMSNYLYAQSQNDPNLAVLGKVPGYSSQQEVEQRVQAKVIANETNKSLQQAYYSGAFKGAL